MIRRRLHRRWLRLYQSPVLSILAAVWSQKRWRWMDRYCNWSVARFGEEKGPQPWWDRAVGRIICWLSDWRCTLSLWFGRHEVPR